MSEPTFIQIRIAMHLSAQYDDLKERHYTSSGLVVNEYRDGHLVAVDERGQIVLDEPLA